MSQYHSSVKELVQKKSWSIDCWIMSFSPLTMKVTFDTSQHKWDQQSIQFQFKTTELVSSTVFIVTTQANFFHTESGETLIFIGVPCLSIHLRAVSHFSLLHSDVTVNFPHHCLDSRSWNLSIAYQNEWEKDIFYKR